MSFRNVILFTCLASGIFLPAIGFCEGQIVNKESLNLASLISRLPWRHSTLKAAQRNHLTYEIKLDSGTFTRKAKLKEIKYVDSNWWVQLEESDESGGSLSGRVASFNLSTQPVILSAWNVSLKEVIDEAVNLIESREARKAYDERRSRERAEQQARLQKLEKSDWESFWGASATELAEQFSSRDTDKNTQVTGTKITIVNEVDSFGDPIPGKRVLQIETKGTVRNSAGVSDNVRVVFITRPENWLGLPSNEQEESAWIKNKEFTGMGTISFVASYANTGADLLRIRSDTELRSKFKFSDGSVVSGLSKSFVPPRTVRILGNDIYTISTKLIGKFFAEEFQGTGKVKFVLSENDSNPPWFEKTSVSGTIDLTGFFKSLCRLTEKDVTSLLNEITATWKWGRQQDFLLKQEAQQAENERQQQRDETLRLFNELLNEMNQFGN